MSAPLDRIVSALEARDCRPRKSGDGVTSRCPAHEDKRASLSASEGKDGRALVKCFTGCETADIVKALGLEMTDLFPPRDEKPKRNGSRGPAPWERPIRATFPYRDAEGNLLFEQVRFEDATDDAGKCAPRYRDASGRWSWKSLTKHLNGTPIPLYRLPELREAVAAGRPVFLPEGEKDVETLRSLGLDATTNYGGADGWKASLAEELVGADVLVLPDNDPPGEKHAEAVVRSLRGKAKTVRVLRLPGLPPKGDVSDWVAAGGTREDLEAMAADLLADPVMPEVDDAEDEGADGDTGRDPSCAAQLIAEARKALLFHDERGDGYAAFTDSSVRRVMKVRGSDFSGELSRRFARSHGYRKAANGEALAAARNVVEALARHEGEEHRLNTRFAMHEGAAWIDMADARWRAIRVHASGWEVVETPPLLFRRFPHMRPLPEPVRGGDLAQLFEPFAMGEAERALLTAYVVTATLAGIPRPVLIVHGPQGAGKSTLLKMYLATVDPTGIDDLDLGGEPREIAQLLDQHAVAFFDNVVKVGDAAARLLCKASTGGGFEKRKLYTDEESVILTFKRAVAVSAINVPTHAPDLLDRTLLIGLDRIAPERRQREADLWRDFEDARPAILGGLLDALSAAMRVYPTLDLPELPRMADFAAWGAAVSEALCLTVGDRTGADAFLAAYTENVGRQTEEVLESDPVARAVRDFAIERGTWTGTASELLAALKAKHEDEMKAKDGGWPRRADGLSRRLAVLHSTLADAGVSLRRNGRTRAARTLTLTAAAAETRDDASHASPRHETAPAAVRTGDASGDADSGRVTPGVTPGPRDASGDASVTGRVTLGVTPNPLETKAGDADDARDASLLPFTAADDFTYDGDGLPRAPWRPGTCPTVEDEEAPVPGAVVRCGRPLAPGAATCREHAGTFQPAVGTAEVRA